MEAQIRFYHASLQNDILSVLRSYNKITKSHKKIDTNAIKRLEIYINCLVKCICFNLVLALNIQGLKTMTQKWILVILDLMFRGVDMEEFLEGRNLNIAYRSKAQSEIYVDTNESQIYIASLKSTNILGEKYIMNSTPLQSLMIKIAHASNKNLCAVGQNPTSCIIENLLIDIFTNSPDLITDESLKSIAKREQYKALNRELCNMKLLG